MRIKKLPSYSFLITFLLLATNNCWSQDCSTFSANFPFGIYSSPCDTALGAINASAQGGMPPYEYTTDTYPIGLQGNSLFDALAAGDYIVTILDQQGCMVKVPVTIPSNQHDTWIGNNSSEWELPINWSAGLVPSSCSDIVIDSGKIIINSNVTVNSLILNNGAEVTVNSGFNLTVLH
jgi:hypothetical protein